LNNAAGSLTYDVTVSNFSGSGLDVTASADTGSDRLSLLALKLNNRKFKLVDYTSPTSTGDQGITGVGFTPQFALLVLSNLDAADPTFPISTSDLMSSLCIASIVDEQWAVSTYIDSGAATTSTSSYSKNQAVSLPTAFNFSTGLQATLASFESDGMTLNYSAVAATGKKGFILFVE
jgi:hypothetical protein